MPTSKGDLWWDGFATMGATTKWWRRPSSSTVASPVVESRPALFDTSSNKDTQWLNTISANARVAGQYDAITTARLPEIKIGPTLSQVAGEEKDFAHERHPHHHMRRLQAATDIEIG